MEWNMDTVSIIGLTEVSSKVTGKKIKLQVLAFTIGKTVEYTKVIGNKIICMVKVSTSGQMEENMKVLT
jgi:hypothetical protein